MGLLWRKVADLDEIAPGGGVRAAVDGEPIVVFRLGEGVVALGARCPHQGNFLGTELLDERTVVCPSHGWAFDAQTGEHRLFRGVRVPVYRTRIRGRAVFVGRSLAAALRRLLFRRERPLAVSRGGLPQ